MLRRLREYLERTRAVDEAAAARLAAIVAHADDAIVGKTLDGVVTSWNAAAERMFGYTAEEAGGRPITLIIPPERLHEEVEILARLRAGETIRHFETIRVRKDGGRVPISLTVSPIRDINGRIVGASKIARDVSERRRGQDELRTNVQRLEAPCRLAGHVARAKDLDGVSHAAIDAIAALGAPRASVLLFDEAGVRSEEHTSELQSPYVISY